MSGGGGGKAGKKKVPQMSKQKSLLKGEKKKVPQISKQKNRHKSSRKWSQNSKNDGNRVFHPNGAYKHMTSHYKGV